jgi:hypothetical protein
MLLVIRLQAIFCNAALQPEVGGWRKAPGRHKAAQRRPKGGKDLFIFPA